MLHKLHIARGEVDLGLLTEAETLELLHAGYLLPSDLYWTEGMTDWKSLAELKLEPVRRRNGRLNFHWQSADPSDRFVA